MLLEPLTDVLHAAPWPADAKVCVEVIAPAYACAGTGALRVVRIGGDRGSIAIAAAYEGYDRLERAGTP